MQRQSGKNINLGRDCRLSSSRLRDALCEGLLATGCDVTDIGTVPTPVPRFPLHAPPENIEKYKDRFAKGCGGMGFSMVGMLIAAAGYLPLIAGAVGQELIDVAAVLNAVRVALPSNDLRDDGV